MSDFENMHSHRCFFHNDFPKMDETYAMRFPEIVQYFVTSCLDLHFYCLFAIVVLR